MRHAPSGAGITRAGTSRPPFAQRLRLGAVLAVFALTAAACGGGNIDGNTPAPSPTAVTGGLTAQSTVGLRNIGPVVINMTVDQLTQAAGVPLLRQDGFDQAAATKNCAFMSPGAIPGYTPPPDIGNKSPILFMIVSGKLARIDILGGGFATTLGVKVGSSEQDVVAAYGNNTPLPPRDFIGPPYRYLTATPRNEADKDYRIVFETDGAKVIKYQVGKLPEVNYHQNCS
jgi:hypothetical protein